MKKLFVCFMFGIGASLQILAQVGVNTVDPKAQIDISSSNSNAPEITDGILIPRINKFPASQPTIDQNGMLVFLDTEIAGFSVGFYYWNNSDKAWYSMAENSFADFYKSGTNIPSKDFEDAIYRYGNISVGGDGVPEVVKFKIILDAKEDHSIKTAFEVENMSSSPKNVTYSMLSNNKSVTSGKKYGIKNTVSAEGEGIHYGIFNETFQKTNEEIYGIFNRVGKTFGATKKHYGIYSEIGSLQGTGTVYGIYSSALGNDAGKVYAGYFAGRVGIGTDPALDYVLPESRGEKNQVLATSENGILGWSYPHSKNYTSTTSSTGNFIIGDEIYTLRINNQVSSITIPEASAHKGRIIILIGWPGISYKTFNFLNGDDILDITTNSQITGISGKERLIIQSAGNRWVVLGN